MKHGLGLAVVCLSLLFFGIGCAPAGSIKKNTPMIERVNFQTTDGVNIVGSFRASPNASRAVLLLHMMPADRTSWFAFQEKLAEQNIASLAIDLRGHGESVMQNNKKLDYQKFSDADHQKYRLDADAALAWLQGRGFDLPQVGIVGASIGANIALHMAAAHPKLAAVALLSPGENYHGVTTFDAAGKLSKTTALWTAGSEKDDQESFDAAKKIVELAPVSTKIFQPFTIAGHGTALFQSHPSVMVVLAEWISVVVVVSK